MLTTLAPELVEDFRREGFVVVPDLLRADELARFGMAVDEGVARRTRLDTRALGEKSRYEQSFTQCQNLWEDCPEVRPLTFHPLITETSARLLGVDAIRIWHDQALYKEAGGRETDAHQDHPYWPINELRTLTAWTPLVEVDDETGCMGYCPGSQTSEAEYVNIFTEPGSGAALVAKQKTTPVFVPAKPGDVLFHHGLTVHLAKANRSNRTRRAYTAIYFADGCTRAPAGAHPSVDREAISPGAVINGHATPIAWPLPHGRYPEPAPWPAEFGQSRFMQRAAKMGVFPGAAAP